MFIHMIIIILNSISVHQREVLRSNWNHWDQLFLVIEFSIHFLKSKCWKQNLVNHYVLPNILNQIQYLSIEILELVILTIGLLMDYLPQ